MQARYYAPMYGRFLSPDPARDQHFEATQSWNIYSYVQNDPTMRIDPDGMQEATGVERQIAANNKKYAPMYASGDPKQIAKANAEMAEQRKGAMVVGAIGLGARFLGGLGVRAVAALMAAEAPQVVQKGQELMQDAPAIRQEAQAGAQATGKLLEAAKLPTPWGRVRHSLKILGN